MIKTGENLRGVSGIYGVIHRQSGKCYVGSSVNVARRYNQHVSDAMRDSTTPFHIALLSNGFDAFDFEILERCEQSKLVVRERFYITLLNSASVDGFNVQRNPCVTYDRNVQPVTRARISAALMGRKLSPEHIAKTAAGLRGKKLSPERCARISAMHKGKPKSEEHRKKIGAGNSNPSPETRAKISAIHKGKPMPSHVREKLRLANLGCKHSSEHIERRVAHYRGKKHSLETIEKMRLAKTGVKMSHAACIAMSEAAKRKPPMSDATKYKLSAIKKGIPKSDETKARMRTAWILRREKAQQYV